MEVCSHIQDGFLHGRGASDRQGTALHSPQGNRIAAREQGAPPREREMLFEGEEEIGSANLVPCLERNRHALRADAAVVGHADAWPQSTRVDLLLRGQLAMELEVHGQHRDLHSGNFGGAVHDPLQALCEIVARLHK